MIKKIYKKLKRGLWTFKQPLAARPKSLNNPVSDLFVWRKSSKWQTYFDLYDIGSFYSEIPSKREVNAKIIFYNQSGFKINEHTVNLNPNQNRCIEISSFIKGEKETFGTFAVFHSNIPSIFIEHKSYLTERGFVSYKYNNNELRHYVHGNSDAISISDNLSYLLGVSSFLKREYKLQFNLDDTEKYEFILINYTNKHQEVMLTFLDEATNKVINVKKYSINPNGCCLSHSDSNHIGNSRLVISSNLVMARPFVFRYGVNKNFFDVFHG